MPKPKVVAIVGPTASGKTGLSIELAKEFSGEVISADSRQVYRELDIGTGKVTKEEMQGIQHHLIDIVDPNEIYTGADFKKDATAALQGILKRDHLPIIAGGTFFYLDLLRNKIQTAPVEPNEDFRSTLETLSNEELMERLETQDPKRAESIDPYNRRRLIRSLEIINELGSVPESVPQESEYEWLIFGIEVEKEVLRKKFAARIKDWLERGFRYEVESLLEKGISRARLDEFGFEYTLMLAHIDEEITEEELIQKFIEKNWQYAKRQMTWLKRDQEIVWIDLKDIENIKKQVTDFLQ